MKNASRLLDIIDRAFNGPVCDEKEFDFSYVVKGVSEVVKKYNISFDKERIVQNDDEMIDRVWEAAVEFLVNCGIYNTSTSRRIVFSRREIEETLKGAPDRATLGTDHDTCEVSHREVGDEKPPVIIGGPIGTVLREDMYLPIMQSYIQEPIIDIVTAGNIETTHGREPRTKSPLEIIASWEEVELMFSAAKRAGRPGISIGAVQMGLSDVGYLSAISRYGYRPSDWHMIAMIGEMKTNNELLHKLTHSVYQNGFIHGFYNPILGGLAGGEEGLAVVITAGMIGLQMLYMSVTHSTCPTHPSLFNDTAPSILRSTSVSTAAISRNSPLMTTVMTSPVGGPGTETVLYECVAMATMASACGVSEMFGVRSGVGVAANHCSGLEARFNGEVAYAAAALDRDTADEIVKKAVGKYEAEMKKKPIGKPFWEVYDPVTIRPTQEWLDTYDKVKDQAGEWGLKFR